MRKRNRKNNLVLIFVGLLVLLGIGYAYLNVDLSISGTTNVKSSSWNVYWDNIQVKSGSVTDVTTPATIKTGKTEVEFNVNFKQPGDYYEFTVDAVNDGSIDAMVNTVTTGVYAANGTTEKTLPDYLEYNVTYEDGDAIEQKHLLKSGSSETYKVRVHYKEDITASQLPSTDDNYMFKFIVNYAQADNSASNRTSYVFRSSNDHFGLGDTFDGGYYTADELLNSSEHINFLRHKLNSNGEITNSSVGFKYNGNIHYLIGGGATIATDPENGEQYYNYDSIYYETNKATLKEAFGEENCNRYVNGSTGVEEFYSCSVSGVYASAVANGYVHVLGGDWGCSVYEDGSSYCEPPSPVD